MSARAGLAARDQGATLPRRTGSRSPRSRGETGRFAQGGGGGRRAFAQGFETYRYLRIERIVSEWTEWHLVPPVAANLASLGWTPEHPRVGALTASTARGHNAVLVAPPSPAWAGPALAGLISHAAGEPVGRVLVLCPPAAVAEWGAAIAELTRDTPLRSTVAYGPSRATRLLRDGAVDLVVVSPEVALELIGRSALRPADLTAVSLIWPEQWADANLLGPLMQDLPKTAQRLLIGTDPVRTAELAERYARRAATAEPPPPTGPTGPVRTVAVAWERRARVVAELIEVLDPERLTVWTADRRLHPALRQALAAAPGAQLRADLPTDPAGTIVAVDLPDHPTLSALLAAGEVILLVPPGTETWVASHATPRRPVILPGMVGDAVEEVRRRRRAIAAAIEAGEWHEAALALAPLFERYEAPAVAAGLYTLWTRRPPAAPASTPSRTEATARVWIGAGRRDQIGPNDVVALLTREIGLDKTLVGRIELRESYTLVEVPEDEAERIAAAISGRTLRRRRLAARVDRGPSTPRPGRRHESA